MNTSLEIACEQLEEVTADWLKEREKNARLLVQLEQIEHIAAHSQSMNAGGDPAIYNGYTDADALAVICQIARTIQL